MKVICFMLLAKPVAAVITGLWVEVTAKVAFENRSEYQGEGIVLYAENVTPCEPLADEMVYFN